MGGVDNGDLHRDSAGPETPQETVVAADNTARSEQDASSPPPKKKRIVLNKKKSSNQPQPEPRPALDPSIDPFTGRPRVSLDDVPAVDPRPNNVPGHLQKFFDGSSKKDKS